MDASGKLVVDAIVYGSQQSNSSANGSITSPELATLEGDQGKGGCIAIVPAAGGRGAAAAAVVVNRSLGRFPDGRDADSLCTDFRMQPATTLSAGSTAGATNIRLQALWTFHRVRRYCWMLERIVNPPSSGPSARQGDDGEYRDSRWRDRHRRRRYSGL
jgi:hypothetical protein